MQNIFSRSVAATGLLVLFLHSPAAEAQQPQARVIAETPPLTPLEQRQKFHLPEGFEIQLVASEPAVRKPINLTFDARGRLLVSGSIEYPLPAARPDRARDAITILTDTDADGTFEHAGTFADGLNIPVGIASLHQGILVYSIPSIDLVRDGDGDRRAGRRQQLYPGFAFDDTHGMPSSFRYWLDGWVYMCHGEGNRSVVRGSDGQQIEIAGGNTCRFRPDGSRIEFFAHGQTNPFGLCFDPLGNLFSADSHSRPAYLLLRDGWYPGLYGADHDGLGFGPPIMTHLHDSTGIAGIAHYSDEQFPPGYRNTLFLGNPVTGRINHDKLERQGSAYRAVALPDFLTCDDPWFRPVDIQLGPDGALYIADFYDRVIGHSLAQPRHAERDHERGRIWRVVHQGASSRSSPVPDLERAAPDEMVRFLEHPNLVIRSHATHQLVERIGDQAIPLVRGLLAGHAGLWQRAHGLWILERLSALDGPTVQALATDPEPAVRIHLLRALAERPQWDGGPAIPALVIKSLRDPDAMVRRAAVEALAQHADPGNAEPLLAIWQEVPADDPQLIYAVRMALRNTLQADTNLLETWSRIAGGRGTERQLADVCLGIRSSLSAEAILRHLRGNEYEVRRLGELVHHVARYARHDPLQELYRWAESFRTEDQAQQIGVLRPLYDAAAARGSHLPPAIARWGEELTLKLLASSNDEALFQGVELAWDLRIPEAGEPLARLAGPTTADAALRSFAMDALAMVDPDRAVGVLKSALMATNEELSTREKAAEALAKINQPPSRSVLLDQLPNAPSSLALTMARGLSHSPAGADSLLGLIEQGRAAPRLLLDPVIEQALRTSRLPGLAQRLEALVKDLPPRAEVASTLVGQRRNAFAAAVTNPSQGAKVFEKHCHTCHRSGPAEQILGPSLEGVGARGLERILEDTLDPDRIVDRKYRSSVVTLTNGRVLMGMIVRSDEQGLVLVDASAKESQVAAADIDTLATLNASLMPSGLAAQIPESEFLDLVAYLLTLQPGKR